jgi:ABC-2 type transport system ATP-binding protein
LVAAGTTVLLPTQYMEEAERLAHQVVVIDRGSVIAHGTATQLKAQLGGAMLEARVADPADLDRAAAVLADVGHARPRIDPDQQLLRIPTAGGTALLLAAGRCFQEQGIALDDLGIRRPSLDDVFLALTGAPADARAGPGADQPPPDEPTTTR